MRKVAGELVAWVVAAVVILSSGGGAAQGGAANGRVRFVEAPAGGVAEKLADALLKGYRLAKPAGARVLAAAQGDGRREGDLMFVQVESGVTCGRAGCLMGAFRAAGGQWQSVWQAWANEVRVVAGGPRVPDLLVDGQTRWRFDGTRYVVAGR